MTAWVLVYQGGHHDVHCRGTQHIWSRGGFVGISRPIGKEIRRGKCDCGVWREIEQASLRSDPTRLKAQATGGPVE